MPDTCQCIPKSRIHPRFITGFLFKTNVPVQDNPDDIIIFSDLYIGNTLPNHRSCLRVLSQSTPLCKICGATLYDEDEYCRLCVRVCVCV